MNSVVARMSTNVTVKKAVAEQKQLKINALLMCFQRVKKPNTYISTIWLAIQIQQ